MTAPMSITTTNPATALQHYGGLNLLPVQQLQGYPDPGELAVHQRPVRLGVNAVMHTPAGAQPRIDLRVVQSDDIVPAHPFHPEAASNQFAILANREHRVPSLIASQSGPDYGLRALPDWVAADSIVNRLANGARRINLGDVDMRRQRKHALPRPTGNSMRGSRSLPHSKALPNPQNPATNNPGRRCQEAQ